MVIVLSLGHQVARVLTERSQQAQGHPPDPDTERLLSFFQSSKGDMQPYPAVPKGLPLQKPWRRKSTPKT